MSEWKIIGTTNNTTLSDQININMSFINGMTDRPASIIDTNNIKQVLYNDGKLYILYDDRLLYYNNDEFMKEITIHSIIHINDHRTSAILTNYNHIVYLFIVHIHDDTDLYITSYDINNSSTIFKTNIPIYKNKIYSIDLYSEFRHTELNMFIQLGIYVKPLYAYIAICSKSFFYNYSLHSFSYRFSKIWTSYAKNVISSNTAILYVPDKRSIWKFLFGSTYYNTLDLTRIYYPYKNIADIPATQQVMSQHNFYDYELSGYDTFIPTKYNIYNNEHIFMYNVHKKVFLYKTEFRLIPIPITLPDDMLLRDIYIQDKLCIVLLTIKEPYNHFDINKKHQSDIYILDISKDFLIIQHLIDSTYFSHISHCSCHDNNYTLFMAVHYYIGNCGCIYKLTLPK